MASEWIEVKRTKSRCLPRIGEVWRVSALAQAGMPVLLGFFAARKILVEHVVHLAGGAVGEIGVADDCGAGVEQSFWIHRDTWRNFDLDQVRPAIFFSSDFAEALALVANAGFIDQGAEAVEGVRHFRARIGKTMAEDGLGHAQDRRCFLVREFENFFQHDGCLLFRLERPSDTGKAESDVLADFIDEPGRAHQIAEALELFGMLGSFLLANALRFHAPAFPLAQMVETGVRGDTEEPALEARFATIAANIFKHAYENVLQQIFGILPQINHAIDVAEKRFAPGFNERAKCSAVTLLSALDEF